MPVLTVGGKLVPRSQLNKRNRSARRKSPTPRRVSSPPRRVQPIGKKGTGYFRQYQLYALQLEGGNYYVGMTSYTDIQKRFVEHLEKRRGAQWTAAHQPLYVLETRKLGLMYQSEAAQLENEMTIEYIDQHGMDRVRGGDMCSLSARRVAFRYSIHKQASSCIQVRSSGS